MATYRSEDIFKINRNRSAIRGRLYERNDGVWFVGTSELGLREFDYSTIVSLVDSTVEGSTTSVLTISAGGTGLSSIGSANQMLGVDNAGGVLEYKTLASGSAGTDFAITHTPGVITFDIPSASATARGLITTGVQTIAGAKTFSGTITFTPAPVFSAITATHIMYAGAAGLLSGSASLTWDNATSIFTATNHRAESGTLAAPSYSFTAQTGSGLFYSAGVRLAYAGALRMFADASGTMIGGLTTNASNYQLLVGDGVGDGLFGVSGPSAAQVAIFIGGTQRLSINASATMVQITDLIGGTNITRIAGGSWGLGLPSATISARLHVASAGTTSATSILLLQDSAATVRFRVWSSGEVGVQGVPVVGYSITTYNSFNMGGDLNFKDANPQIIISGNMRLNGNYWAFPFGNVTNPGVTFNTRTTDGMYSKAANEVGFVTNSILSFYIDSSQRIVINDKNIILGTTTGTKIGTAATQKLGFWNATPIVQPTTAIGAATLINLGGTTLTDTDTFDGYTLKQIVKALRDAGILA